MSNQLISEVYQWLSLLNVSVERRYVSERLLSHPDYPSALCITSLLDDLGIENGVIKIDETQLSEIPTPFLVFIDREKFRIVTSIETIENLIVDFSTRWNGVVVYAEKPVEITRPDELKKIKKLEHGVRIRWTMAVIVMAIVSGMTLLQSTLTNAFLYFLSILGILVSGSIVLRELGVDSVVSQKLCGKSENAGCDSVLQATESKHQLNVRYSDVGVSFFLGVLTLLTLNSIVDEDFQRASRLFVAIASLASIPFTFYLIYFQWKIVERWCRSCLIVVAILWTMALLQSQFPFSIDSIDITMALRVVCLFVLPGSWWLIARSHLDQKQELIDLNFSLQRVYRSPELFQNHLFSQRKIDATPWEHDFQIGNSKAGCQIIVLSNHFCGPCLETHELLRQLLTKHQGKLGITVRYTIDLHAKNDPKTSIVTHMLKYSLSAKGFLKDPQRVEEMLSAWYRWKDPEKFIQLYPVHKEKIDVDDLLELQHQWAKTSELNHTPVVIINGYKLEHPYSAVDLLEFSPMLIDLFSTVESRAETLTEDTVH